MSVQEYPAVDRLPCVDIPFHHVPLSVRRQLAVFLEPESVYDSGHCWRDVGEELGFSGDEIRFIGALRLTASKTGTEILLDKYSNLGSMCTVGKFCAALRTLRINRALEYMIRPEVQKDQYRPKIFISYGTDVENEVCRIASNLNKGYDCFLDAPNVSHDEIRKRLSDSDFLIVCLSPDYQKDMITDDDEQSLFIQSNTPLHAGFIFQNATDLYKDDKVIILVVKPVEVDLSCYLKIYHYNEEDWTKMTELLKTKSTKISSMKKGKMSNNRMSWILKKSLCSRIFYK